MRNLHYSAPFVQQILCPQSEKSGVSSSRAFHTLFFFPGHVLGQAVLAQVPQAGFLEAGCSCCWVLLLLEDPHGPGQAGGIQPFCWGHQDREEDGGGREAPRAEAAQGNLCHFLTLRNSSWALPRQGEAALCPDAAGVLTLPPTHESSLLSRKVGWAIPCLLAPRPALSARCFPCFLQGKHNLCGSIGPWLC